MPLEECKVGSSRNLLDSAFKEAVQTAAEGGKSERDDKDMARQGLGIWVLAEYHAYRVTGIKVRVCALAAVASQAQPPVLNKPI